MARYLTRALPLAKPVQRAAPQQPAPQPQAPAQAVDEFLKDFYSDMASGDELKRDKQTFLLEYEHLKSLSDEHGPESKAT